MKLLFVFLFLFLAPHFVVQIWGRSHSDSFSPDFIIVLGANGNPSSPIVVERAQLAHQASLEYPEAKIIITGNENNKEVTTLRELILTLGVPQQRLLLETQSRTTRENFLLSQKLISSNSSLLVVTNKFHLFRAVTIAKSLGFKARGYFQADIKNYHFKYSFREWLACLKFIYVDLFFASSSVAEKKT